MSKVRGSGNASTEIKLIALFRQTGIKGWRRKQRVFGKPDFVFKQAKLAVFVDGCFWHGHPTLGRIPKSNRRFWLEKIAKNKARDRHVNRQLKAAGWTVIRFWENEAGSGKGSLKVKRIIQLLG